MGRDHSVHYMSERMDWGTPIDLFCRLQKIYGFDLDAACNKSNKLCANGCTYPERNGLKESWAGKRVWCNPPYGRSIIDWVRKAIGEAAHAECIVMLVPSRTDTVWFHEAIQSAKPIFLKGRLKFQGAPSVAPFPSILLVWQRG